MVPPKKRYRTERVQVMLEEAELKAIEDWRFQQRMTTRTAAVRELLRLGLKVALYRQESAPTAQSGDIHSKSTDFAVLDRGEPPEREGPAVVRLPQKTDNCSG